MRSLPLRTIEVRIHLNVTIYGVHGEREQANERSELQTVVIVTRICMPINDNQTMLCKKGFIINT